MNDTVEVNVELTVGNVAESVDVSAETPLLSTAESSLGQVIDQRRVQELPSFGGSPMVLVQLEEFGFCGRGEAKDYVADGGIEIGGNLAVNTNGGQLGEAYIHGMNGIAEAVRQVRGTAVNQIDGLEHAIATGGTGVPTSAVLVGVDR